MPKDTEEHDQASPDGKGDTGEPDVIPMAVAEPLTAAQRLELAACFAEYCGVEPDDPDQWRKEMVAAKRFISDIISFWRLRAKARRKAIQHEGTKPST